MFCFGGESQLRISNYELGITGLCIERRDLLIKVLPVELIMVIVVGEEFASGIFFVNHEGTKGAKFFG